MTGKNKSQAEQDAAEENLIGVGQQILGDLEIVGAILTGDPVTRAEGEFNAGVGRAHQENSRAVVETERDEKENG